MLSATGAKGILSGPFAFQAGSTKGSRHHPSREKEICDILQKSSMIKVLGLDQESPLGQVRLIF